MELALTPMAMPLVSIVRLDRCARLQECLPPLHAPPVRTKIKQVRRLVKIVHAVLDKMPVVKRLAILAPRTNILLPLLRRARLLVLERNRQVTNVLK